MAQGHGFLYELRRRHVVRVAIAYTIVAWVLLQLASILFPTFGAPEWVLKVVVAFLAIGFPVALVLAWAFEMTPDGIRRTEPAHSPDARPAEVTHRVGKQLNTIIIAVLALVIVLLLADRFLVHKSPAPAASAPAPGKSIAVLPFENLSDDKSNGYFASGMQDEILTRLAGIRDLKVISRTSTEKYASHPPDLKTVGRELDVASVLEGSVQKIGDAVHINVQLIDTGNDSHLWAQSYNRELKDVFALEADVAQSIADALKAKLQPQESERVAAVPTTDPAAYDLYLRAMERFNRANDAAELTATEMPLAIALFERALDGDPNFALAEARLGIAQMYMYFNAGDRTEARLAKAKTAIDRALALQPGLGEAHLALALWHYWGHRDYAAAAQQLRLASESLPNSADVASIQAAVARRQGRWEEAIAGFKRSAQFDPRSPYPLDQLSLSYQGLRRYAEADQAAARALPFAQDEDTERVSYSWNAVLWRGDLAPLRAALHALRPGSDTYAANANTFFYLAWLSRDYAAAAEVARSDASPAWQDTANILLPRELYLAWALAASGDNSSAGAAYSRVRPSVGEALAQRPDSAELHLALAFADAGLGDKEGASREARRAIELLPVSLDVVSGCGILAGAAQVEARVGNADAAFGYLRQALAQPSGTILSAALLRLDPVWDPLRKDPRFAELLELGASDVAIKPQG
jgi:TolB-like protein/Tfp pilus assembly protein PilF